MRTVLKIFFNSEVNSSAVLVALLFASIAEGFGWASLVPLLSVLTPDTSEQMSGISAYTREILTALNIPMTAGVLIGFFVATMIVNALMLLIAKTYVGNAVADVSTGLRSQLIRNIFQVRWSYLIDHPLGLFTNAVSGQVQRASEAFELTSTFFIQVISSITYLVVAFAISWPLALAAIALGLFMWFALHVLVRLSRSAGNKETHRTRELVIFLSDTLTNIKPLRAMMRQQAFGNLLESKIRLLRKAIRKRVVSTAGLAASQDILLAITLGYGAYLAVTDWAVPITELAVVGVLLRKTVTNITKVQRLFQKAVGIERPYIEVTELIEETDALPEPNPGKQNATLEHSLCVSKVNFSYGDHQVLDQVSLCVELGKITVMTGASGSGKSTLADILIGLTSPDSGQVLLDGEDLRDIDLNTWRQMIGYVPQELVLFHDTVFANVALGDPDVTGQQVREALDRAGALGFVDAQRDGLMTVVGQHGAKLSGGQRQRIAIARALLSKPRLLILDEVTSALDPVAEQALCEKIRDLSGNTTVLAITHRPALLGIADRVIHLEEGKIVAR